MPYATYAQAIAIYGESYIATATTKSSGGAVQVDIALFEKHLECASREMNMYLLGRYGLPLLTPPEHFQKLCVDIAIYTASTTADVCTREIRRRYWNAVGGVDDEGHRIEGIMPQIAVGKLKLEVATDTTVANASQSPAHTVARTSQIILECGARELTSESLKRVI